MPAQVPFCQVHQQAATGPCLRCGTFICGECSALSICSACVAHAMIPGAGEISPQGKKAQRLALLSWTAPLVIVLGGGVFAKVFEPALWALACFFPVGFGAGVWALKLHPGTRAPRVQGPAPIGIGLNALFGGFYVWLAWTGSR